MDNIPPTLPPGTYFPDAQPYMTNCNKRCGNNYAINRYRQCAMTTWKINYLVSNRKNRATYLDVELINPWGIAILNNNLWVICAHTDRIKNYNLYGGKLLRSVTVRNAAENSTYPTGIAINCCSGFAANNGERTVTGLIITATEHGTVHIFNPNDDPINSFIVLNTRLTGEISVFRGLAIANNTLYLANFFRQTIDVYDNTFNKLSGYHFIDTDTSNPIPPEYGPNNIVNIGSYLYVLWAKKDSIISVHNEKGIGTGYISIFNFDGSFVRRFASRGVLNSPWAMIPAPCELGYPLGSFVVGNNGDGRINIFDCNGSYICPLVDQRGLPIIIEGLWGLAPYYTSFSEIFFTGSQDQNNDGCVGSLVKDQVIYY